MYLYKLDNVHYANKLTTAEEIRDALKYFAALDVGVGNILTQRRLDVMNSVGNVALATFLAQNAAP